MIGYKKNGDGFILVDIQKDSEGNPIVEDGVILEQPPLDKAGYHLTIENGEWVFIEDTYTDKDLFKGRLMELNAIFPIWEKKYRDRPFVYNNDIFPNDSKFKEMMNSAMGAKEAWGILPKLWISATNKVITPVTEEFLNGLGRLAYESYENSIMKVLSVRSELDSITEYEELELFNFPFVDTVESLLEDNPEIIVPAGVELGDDLGYSEVGDVPPVEREPILNTDGEPVVEPETK